MASVVNLNRFRKAKKRTAAQQQTAENRTLSARSKADRRTSDKSRRRAERELNGKRLD